MLSLRVLRAHRAPCVDTECGAKGNFRSVKKSYTFGWWHIATYGFYSWCAWIPPIPKQKKCPEPNRRYMRVFVTPRNPRSVRGYSTHQIKAASKPNGERVCAYTLFGMMRFSFCARVQSNLMYILIMLLAAIYLTLHSQRHHRLPNHKRDCIESACSPPFD